MKDSFIFYRSFFDVLKEVPDETKLNLINAMAEFALNDKEISLNGMAKALFVLIKPQLEANAKRYQNGKKGGRPKQTKPETSDIECKFAPDSVEVESFISDFQAYKNSDFQPTTAERKNIAIVLSELNGYDSDYWQKVFISAKGGYLINGQIVPCNLRKILLEHNSIFAGEANLAPNKEHIEEIKQINKAKKSKKENEYKNIAEEERQKREQAFSNINSSESAVKYLNEYVVGGKLAKSIASDFKELSKIYDIGLSSEGVFYDKAC